MVRVRVRVVGVAGESQAELGRPRLEAPMYLQEQRSVAEIHPTQRAQRKRLGDPHSAAGSGGRVCFPNKLGLKEAE